MSQNNPPPDKIALALTEAAKDCGIQDIYIENKKTVTVIISLPNNEPLILRENINYRNFPQMVRKLMKDAKSMLSTKGMDKAVINEIGYQIGTVMNEEQNYELFEAIGKEEMESKLNGRGKDAQVLTELASNQENVELLFKNQYGEPFAAVRVGEDRHLEIIPLESNRFERYLLKLFHEKQRKLASSDAIKSVISLLCAKTFFGDMTIPLHLRVAWGQPNNRARPGHIYIDMTDSTGRMIEVSSEDGWRIIDGNEPNIPILFRRHNQTPHVEPDRKYPSDIFDRFISLTNVKSESHKQLLKVYIISLLIPDIDHTILTTYGPKGAAKTFLLWLIKSLIDPSKPVLLTLLRNIPEFIQQVNHNYLAFYDNVKYVPYWLSDEICKAVTGIGHTKRKLYTDDQDIILEHRHCIGINGIDVALTEPDAMDRSLFVKLLEILENDVKIKEDIIQEFEKIRPQLLGFILDILVKALKIKPTLILPRLSRMAGFTLWGEAISRALGYENMSFVNAYFENRNELNIVAVEESLVGGILVSFYNNHEERNGNGVKFEGSPGELYRELIAYAEKNEIFVNSHQFPKAPNILVKKINAIRSNLKQAYGIIFDISRDRDNCSVVTIYRYNVTVALEKVCKANVVNHYYEHIIQTRHTSNSNNLDFYNSNMPKVTSGTSEPPVVSVDGSIKPFRGSEASEVNVDNWKSDITKNPTTADLPSAQDETDLRECQE